MKNQYFLIIVIAFAISIIPNSVCAQTSSISLSMQKDMYYPNDVVVINGTSTSDHLVTVEIKNPFDKSVFEKSLLPSTTGTFSISYVVDRYPTKGTYVVIATQNSTTSASYFGVYTKPAIRLEATMDKINYENTDKANITILDLPESIIGIKILDNSQVQKFEDKITTARDGHAVYSLDISSYPVGVYNVLVTSSTDQVKLGFSVGLMPVGGHILINTEKSVYAPGNDVLILGTSYANSLIELSLVDPNGNSVQSDRVFSDNTGHFTTSQLTIPPDAVSGNWRINASSGVNHESLDVRVVRSIYGDKNENVTSVNDTATFVLIKSPLQQFKSGVVAKDVICNDDLQLIFKTEGNFPACVKTPVVFHLSELGWGYPPSPFIIKTDLLNSTISGGKIKELQYDLQSRSVIIKIQTTSDGSLMVTIPKFITDLNPYDKPFKDFHTVLADNMEENVDLVPTANGSSFTIPFTNGTQEIEIMGNYVGQQR